MDKHPIESLMTTTMESIRDMIDVNTVIGEPVITADGTTIIPLSRVSFGFVAGGGEYAVKEAKQGQSERELPFGGGTGAGVTVQPMGFLAVADGQVKLLPAYHNTPIDRAIELVPQLFSEIKKAIGERQGERGAQGA